MAIPLRWIPRLIRWTAPLRKGTQEAADQQLGKLAKLRTKETQDQVDDLRELGEQDRDSVERFRNEKMGWKSATQGAQKDSWVCDDMVINAAGRSSILEWFFVAAAGAAAMWFFGEKLKTDDEPPPQQQEIVVPDTEYEVRFYDKDGNQILVPRKPQ